jgi:diguanylate cyclase (GGDEF)-like protein/PAS domain S-box-containing protein
MKAPIPANEAARLQTLDNYCVLDTQSEEVFDELTKLAASICGVPIALISLVDESRQWFKSRVGINASETPRDIAFCAHAILRPSELLEVVDAQLDNRFVDNPLVTGDPKIRFYAGAPLVAPNGLSLGTLCVIDTVPRKLNDHQKFALDYLSKVVINQLELHKSLALLRSAELKLKSHNIVLESELQQEVMERYQVEVNSRQVLDAAFDAVITVNQDLRLTYFNYEAAVLFGYSLNEQMNGDIYKLILPSELYKNLKKDIAIFLKNHVSSYVGKRIEILARHADGSNIPIEFSLIGLKHKNGYFFNAFIRDLSTKRKSIEDLRLSNLVYGGQEAIIITDVDMKILRVNQAFIDITGYMPEEVVGTRPHILHSSEHDENFYLGILHAINTGSFWEGEIWDKRKNGETFPQHLIITAVKDSNKVVANYVISFSDITERKKAATDIYNLAFYDPLTNLPNRRFLMDKLLQALETSSRSGLQGALIFIDLDNFKTLNDTLGHDLGDLLLQNVANRLKASIRKVDTVARLGGDEFVIILEGLGELGLIPSTQIELVANKILATISTPYRLSGHTLHITTSIGATLFNNHFEKMDELLKQADIAMYQAKKAGRNTYRFFDPNMQENIRVRATLENALRHAIKNNEFELHYQRQVDGNYQPIGAEALIRWKHPSLGMIPPSEFIPMAEENGLIIPIGQWVLETACSELKRWIDLPYAKNQTIAVNVSAIQFHSPDFVEDVRALIKRTGINADKLKFEMTESLVLNNVNDSIVKMNALKEMGIQFALDDFGTGYSSLSYLSQLPLTFLKIDRSFVQNVIVNRRVDGVIVETIIGMAKSLGLEVIAEGVETIEQRDFLEQHGCPMFQGYLFGKPMAVKDYEATLKQSLSY